MQYFGGKARLAKKIAAIIESARPNSTTFTDVFTGGLNVVCAMSGERIANDGNVPLINMYKAIQEGWEVPSAVTKEEYDRIKAIRDPADPMTAFAGIACSYGGKWFGGYAKNKRAENFALQAKNSLARKFKKLDGVEFTCANYQEVNPTGIMYCDPPYAETTKYGYFDGFDNEEFWEQVREWSAESIVFVSEYQAPDDFACIAQFGNDRVQFADRAAVERLFVHRSNICKL